MRVYVGTWGKYNAGSLKGDWLEIEDYNSYEEFIQACRELHSDEVDPEFMYQDWEDIPDGLIDQSWISPLLWEILSLDELDREKVFFLIEEYDMTPDKALKHYEEVTVYTNATMDDVVEELIEEGVFGKVPESIKPYIDYEALKDDLVRNEYYREINGSVFHFYPC